MPTRIPKPLSRSTAILVGIAVTAATGSGRAQEVPAPAPVPARATLVGTFVETYQPEVAVSGSVIVGVMGLSAVGDLAADRLVVRSTGREEDRRICFRVTSRDGIYSSENRYELPGSAPDDEVVVPYDSKHREVIGGFSETDVGMTARLGACDDPNASYLVIGRAEGGGDLLIFVNSFEATDVFWSLVGDDEAPLTDCSEITEGRRTTFDFTCRVPRPATPGPFTVAIERERFGREQPRVEIRILGAAE